MRRGASASARSVGRRRTVFGAFKLVIRFVYCFFLSFLSLFTYAERVNSHYDGSSNVIKVISTHKLDIHPLPTFPLPLTQQSCNDSSVIRSLTALFVVIVTVISNLLCRTVWSGLVSSSAFTRMWKISLCIGNQVFGFTLQLSMCGHCPCRAVVAAFYLTALVGQLRGRS